MLTSQGVPMIVYGDELGRTQNGNNNGYCQDNELSWIDWSKADSGLVEFTKMVAELRAQHPVFRRRKFFDGGKDEKGLPDVGWLRPDAAEMTEDDWSSGFSRAVTVFLNGDAIPELGPRGEHITDESFLMLLNASGDPIKFTLPAKRYGAGWSGRVDTSVVLTSPPEPAVAAATAPVLKAGRKITVPAHSMLILERTAV